MLIRPYLCPSKLCILWILVANGYGLSDSGNFNETSFRISRDTTDSLLLDFTNNLNRLSRLTNGLSLEIGLIDGSLQSDTVLQDLLHLGSLKFQDLSSLDMKTVSGSVSKLEAVSKGLDSSEDVTKIEKRFSIFEEIRVSEDMDVFVALPGKNEYRSLLDEVVKLGETQVDLTFTKTKVNLLASSLSDIGYWAGSLTEDAANDAKNVIGGIPTIMKNVEDAVKSFEPLKSNWSMARSLRDNSKFLDILYTESYFRGNLSDTLKFGDPEVMGKVRKNVDSLYDLRAKIEGSGVTILQKFLETSGVSNDLEALKSDIEDPWISARIMDTKERLKIAVSSFDPVIGELAKVREDWKMFLDEDSTRQSSNLFVDSKLEVLKIPEDNKPILDVIEKLEKCAVDRETTGATLEEALKNIIPLIKELNGKIDQVESLDYIKELKDLSTLKSFLSVTKKPDETNVQFISEIAKKVTADPKFKSVKRILARFQKELDFLNPLISEVPELVNKITPEFRHVDRYQKSVNNTLYTDFYKCVKNVGENGAGVKMVFESLDKVREIGKSKDLDTTKSVIQAIESSQKDLKTLKDTVENLKKGSAIPEVKDLKESFPNSQKVSQELSKAVEGLEGIGKALESRDSLKILQDSKLLGRVQNLLDSDDGGIIQKMSELKNYISKTFQDIDEISKVFQDSRKTRSTLDFKSNGRILEAASKISDVKFDVDPLKQALESSKPKLKIPELSDLLKSLDSLKSLDLEFSKYGFKDAASSLEALDVFFVTYSKLSRVSAQPSPKPLVGQKPNGTQIGAISGLEPTTEYSVIKNNLILFIVLIVLLFLAAIGIAACLCCCCKKTSKMDLEEGNADQKPDEKKNKRSSSNPVKSRNPKKTSQSTETNSKGSTISKIENAIPPTNDSNTGSSESNQAGLAKDPVKVEVKNEEKASKSGKAKRSKPSKSRKSKPSKPSKSSKAKPSKPSKSNKSKRSKSNKSKPSKPSGGSKIKTPKVDTVAKNTAPSAEAGNRGVYLEWLGVAIKAMVAGFIDKSFYPIQYAYGILNLVNEDDQIHIEVEERLQNHRERIVYRSTGNNATDVMVEGFENGYINASWISFGTQKWIVSQMPMDGTEVLDKRGESLRNSTIAKHLAMIIQQKFGIAIQSTPFEDDKGKRICMRFYSKEAGKSMSFEQHTVTTISSGGKLSNVKNSNKFEKFELEVKDRTTGIAHRFDLVQYSWPDDDAPDELEDAFDIVKICESYAPKSVLLQCLAGTGPSGTILGIKIGIERCLTQKVDNLADLMRNIRAVRASAIENNAQVFYLMACVAEGVRRRANVQFLENVSAMTFFYRRWTEGNYKVYVKGRTGKDSYHLYENEKKAYEEFMDEEREKHASGVGVPVQNKGEKKNKQAKRGKTEVCEVNE